MNNSSATAPNSVSSENALKALIEGNLRFQNNVKQNRDHRDEVRATSSGQYPFATVLSCIDSRVSSELIFDQGIGDLFSVKIAGNFVNSDILGSMEFACKVAGTKLLVVLGHTSCGAVKGACDHVKLGNLTSMLENISPAVEAITEPTDASQRTSKNLDFVDKVAAKNVMLTIDRICSESPTLEEMKNSGELKIIGGMYDISTGAVTFYN
jgi:carbonic anhydrase